MAFPPAVPSCNPRQKVGVAFIHANPDRPLGKASDPKLRKIIRSHISRVQHSQRPKSGDTCTEFSDIPKPSNDIANEGETVIDASNAGSWRNERPPLLSKPARHGRLDSSYDYDFHQHGQMIITTATIQQPVTRSSIHAIHSQMSAIRLQRNPQDMTDDLQSYLKPLKLSMSDCLARYDLLLSRIISDNQDNSPLPEQDTHSYMHSMIKPGATYRATAIFSAAANLISQMGQSLDQPAFLRLYGHVLEGIHNALRHPDTAEDEDIMLSISGLMWFEAFYGSREQYRVHLNGLIAMATSPKRSRHAAAVTLTEWTKTNSADTTRSRRFMDSTRISEFDQ